MPAVGDAKPNKFEAPWKTKNKLYKSIQINCTNKEQANECIIVFWMFRLDRFTVYTDTSSPGYVDMDISATSAIVFGVQCQNGVRLALTDQMGVQGPPNFRIDFYNNAAPQYTFIK